MVNDYFKSISETVCFTMLSRERKIGLLLSSSFRIADLCLWSLFICIFTSTSTR